MPAPPLAGVVLISDDLGQGYAHGDLFGALAYFPSTQPAADCAPTALSEECTLVPACVPAPGAPAGDIDVTGLTIPLHLTPIENGMYAGPGTIVQPSPLVADQLLRVRATGNEVPAFVGSVTTPDVALVTAPIVPMAGGRIAIAPSVPFTVAWQAPVAGDVGVRIHWATSRLDCVFPRSEGVSVSIPPHVLVALPKGPTTVRIDSSQTTRVSSPPYSVTLEVRRGGEANGLPAIIPATIE